MKTYLSYQGARESYLTFVPLLFVVTSCVRRCFLWMEKKANCDRS